MNILAAIKREERKLEKPTIRESIRWINTYRSFRIGRW